MISIIICSVTPEKFARVSANFKIVLGEVLHEVIGIHDAQSLSEGYNRGIARASGDVLIFCHDDIEIISPDFHARISAHLQNHDLIGCVGTNCLIDSAWIAGGDPYIHGVVAYPVADSWPSERFDLAGWGGGDSALGEKSHALVILFFFVKTPNF